MQKIIDISKWQSVTSWGNVAKNVDAVILKASQGRGLTSDTPSFTDPKFHTFAKAAISKGIPLGAYHFLTASTVAEAVKEADYFCNVIKPYRDSIMFAVCDAENYNNKYLLGLSRAQLTDVINAFCLRVEASGFTAMHYTNVDHINNFIDINRIPYPCWCAAYGNTKPTIAGNKLVIWQYTDKGKVSGIVGNVDMNHGYFDDTKFAIYRLQAAGVIDSPAYWIENHKKIPYLGTLLKRCADKISKAGGK